MTVIKHSKIVVVDRGTASGVCPPGGEKSFRQNQSLAPTFWHRHSHLEGEVEREREARDNHAKTYPGSESMVSSSENSRHCTVTATFGHVTVWTPTPIAPIIILPCVVVAILSSTDAKNKTRKSRRKEGRTCHPCLSLLYGGFRSENASHRTGATGREPPNFVFPLRVIRLAEYGKNIDE